MRFLNLFTHGSYEWMLQRMTAFVMTFYVLSMAALLMLEQPWSYEAWQTLFANGTVKLASYLFLLSLLLHAWIGYKDVLADYVRLRALRLGLKAIGALALLIQMVWSAQILWGNLL
jgi:succinate dehydrogenase / fumarate reductase, membrane anchor subunit